VPKNKAISLGVASYKIAAPKQLFARQSAPDIGRAG